jgi:hypothetical protein
MVTAREALEQARGAPSAPVGAACHRPVHLRAATPAGCLPRAVCRAVILTAGMLAPADRAPWARVWQAMRRLAAEHGDENVRLVVWFG